MVLRIGHLLAKGHFFSFKCSYFDELELFRSVHHFTANMIYAKTGPCKGQIFPLCAPPQQLYNKHMAHRNQVGHYGATHWGKSERNSCRMRTSHMMRFSSIQNAEKTELFSQGLFLSVISSYAAWVCAKAIWILWLRSFAKIYISRRRVYFFESKPPWANFELKV